MAFKLFVYLLLSVLGLWDLLQQLFDYVKLALDEWIVVVLGPVEYILLSVYNPTVGQSLKVLSLLLKI